MFVPHLLFYIVQPTKICMHIRVCAVGVVGTSIEVYMDYMDINFKMLRYYPYHM